MRIKDSLSIQRLLFLYLMTWNPLFALPSGGEVVQGSATLLPSSNTLQVNANGKAILHWDQFTIGSGEAVYFAQSQKGQAILNRVSSGSASEILGSLQADCPIYLINPNGIFIGSSACIDTAGFLASTADLSNETFWQGSEMLFQEFGNGHIVNLGKIHASHGDVFLIARGGIDNQGTIEAPNGIALLTSREMMLYPDTKKSVFIRVSDAAEERIQNSGTIQALAVELNTASPYERAIQHTGSIETFSTVEQNGKVYLVAERGEAVVNGSVFSEAGEIRMLGQKIRLEEQAHIDVSSGSIQIEGGESVYVDRGAELLANARIEGNGGSISLLAEQEMFFHGQAEACGGEEGGDGGVIHVSSHGSLDCDPIVRATASKGRSGTFFLDPQFVFINSSGSDSPTGNTFATDPSGTAIMSGLSLQDALDAANVVIQANTDIVFQDLVMATTTNNSLTLQAGRSIQIGGNLSLTAGDFHATINDSGALALDREPGIASFTMGIGSSIATQGGNITVDVGTFDGLQEGVINITGGLLDAGGGNIAMIGYAGQNADNSMYGIYMGASTVIQTSGAGALSLQGTGGLGANQNIGVYLQMAQLQTDSGLLQIIGHGGGNGTGNGSVGIYSSAIVTTLSNGPIVFTGIAGSGVHGNMGIYLNQGMISTLDGDITLDGRGGGTGAMNFGIRLESNAQCTSSGGGAIALTGISGHGKNNNHGVSLSEGTLSANTGSIAITGTGYGSVSYNYGIRLEGRSQCSSLGTATITLNGENSAGVNGNSGISITTSGKAVSSVSGDIQIQGISAGTGKLNEGPRLESGQIVSAGIGTEAANIHLTGVGGEGTDYCNGVSVQGIGGIDIDMDGNEILYGTVITSIDGNILLEGDSRGSGQYNQALDIDPSSYIEATGSGTVSYIEN